MRLFRYIFFVLLAVSVFACEDDEYLYDQEVEIEEYLDTYYEDEYEDLDGVYRVFLNDTSLTEGNTEIKSGTNFSIYYNAYTFDSSVGDVFMSNIASTVDDLMAADTLFNGWDTNALNITLGSTSLVKGLEKGLKGAHKGDELIIIMNSEYGFGDNQVGNVPADTPLYYEVAIVND